MKPVDVDESWLVMLYSFFIHAVADGMGYSLGIIGTQLIERREYSRELVAWIPTIFITSYKLSAFLASSCYRLYGCRVAVVLGGILTCGGYFVTGLSTQNAVIVYIFIGAVSGIGYNFLYVPTWIAANTYYRTRRQLANGLVMSGSAIGVVIFPPVVDWLLDAYGLQGTFMIMGGIALNTIVVGALIPPLVTAESKHLLYQPLEDLNEKSLEDGEIDDDSKTKKNLCKNLRHNIFHTFIGIDLFKNWKYTVYVLASCFTDPITLHTLYTYVPDFIVHIGFPAKKSWQPITLSGVSNTLARFFMGTSNKSTSVITTVYAQSALMVGIPLTIFSLSIVTNHYSIICINSVVYGFGKGLFWSLRGPVLAEIVSQEDFDRALGTEQFFTGFLMLFCPLQGKLFDITGEYTWTFLLSGSMSIIGGIFLWILAMHFIVSLRKN